MPTWTLDANERQALQQRFVRYVKIDTQSDENSSCSPSTEKQKDLARLLVGELAALGCPDAVWIGISSAIFLHLKKTPIMKIT